jgi:TetR/AcrR family transcriptional regulator, cholesterol catabolism regulator
MEQRTERGAREHTDDVRYQRLMAATRAAARDGYEAVSMRELAETCKLSMTTIYQFCRSKDHLIAEAHLEGMEDFRRRLMTRPPKGATADERVKAVMRSFAKALEVDEVRSRTLMRAMYSLDPEVGPARSAVGRTYTSMIDLAVGDEPIEDRDAAIGTLGHVIGSVIVVWLTSRRDAPWVRQELETAARLLIRPPAAIGRAKTPDRKRAPRRPGLIGA